METTLRIYANGGAVLRNDGTYDGYSSYLIRVGMSSVDSQSFFIGQATINQAEYIAAINAAEIAAKAMKIGSISGLIVTKCILMLDSELVIAHLTGSSEIKSLKLAGYYMLLKDIIDKSKISVEQIPASDNMARFTGWVKAMNYYRSVDYAKT